MCGRHQQCWLPTCPGPAASEGGNPILVLLSVEIDRGRLAWPLFFFRMPLKKTSPSVTRTKENLEFRGSKECLGDNLLLQMATDIQGIDVKCHCCPGKCPLPSLLAETFLSWSRRCSQAGQCVPAPCHRVWRSQRTLFWQRKIKDFSLPPWPHCVVWQTI